MARVSLTREYVGFCSGYAVLERSRVRHNERWTMEGVPAKSVSSSSFDSSLWNMGEMDVHAAMLPLALCGDVNEKRGDKPMRVTSSEERHRPPGVKNLPCSSYLCVSASGQVMGVGDVGVGMLDDPIGSHTGCACAFGGSMKALKVVGISKKLNSS